MKYKFIDDILTWYEQEKRNLPWRETKDPYKIWVCEVIFQQTRINQGMEYYKRFIKRFPDVDSLAEVHENEVLKLWEGLGYYSRARNLHWSAKHIVNELNGEFPSSYKAILTLKGVGPYTAAAIASICFDEKVAAIDGNALRVYARLFNSFLNIAENSTSKEFKEKVEKGLSKQFGNYNQAIMELGALVCMPKNPQCSHCPISKHCMAYKSNNQNVLPIKDKRIKVSRETLDYTLFYNVDGLFIQQRKDAGIWKNLFELMPIIPGKNKKPDCIIQHKLTHKILSINFFSEKWKESNYKIMSDFPNATFVKWEEISLYAFPKPIKSFVYNFEKNTIFEKIKVT